MLHSKLAADARVYALGERLIAAGALSPMTAGLGALAQLYAFALANAGKGNVIAGTVEAIDKLVGIPNLCELMPPEWLQVIDSQHVKLPELTTHNETSEHSRASSRLRMRAMRERRNVHVTRNSDVTSDVTKRNVTRNQTSTHGTSSHTQSMQRIREPLTPTSSLTSLPISIPVGIGGGCKGEPKIDARHASRIPANWEPSDADIAFAIGKGLDPKAIRDEFKDYWNSSGQANARKLDWSATWRNWCRKAKPVQFANRFQPKPMYAKPAPADELAELVREAAQYPDMREPYMHESPAAYRTALESHKRSPPKLNLSQLTDRMRINGKA